MNIPRKDIIKGVRKKQNYVFSHNFLDNCHFVKIYSYRYFIFLQQYTISDKTIFYLPFFYFFSFSYCTFPGTK